MILKTAAQPSPSLCYMSIAQFKRIRSRRATKLSTRCLVVSSHISNGLKKDRCYRTFGGADISYNLASYKLHLPKTARDTSFLAIEMWTFLNFGPAVSIAGDAV